MVIPTMGTNNYRAHVHVIPEDDANRELANGFVLGMPSVYSRAIQILHPADGWIKLLDKFESFHVLEMRTYPLRHIVLLIDFDDDANRLNRIKSRVPADLEDRVFVLGTESEPENLKPQLGPYFETIGLGLAEDCRVGSSHFWGHPLLLHNSRELLRLNERVKPMLFP
jgi:hypothetical protein